MGGLIKIIFSLTVNAILNLDEGVLELRQQRELLLDLVDCARVDSLGHQLCLRLKHRLLRTLTSRCVMFQNTIPFSLFNRFFLTFFAKNLTRWSSTDSRWIRDDIRIAPVHKNSKEQISGGVIQPPSILNIQH